MNDQPQTESANEKGPDLARSGGELLRIPRGRTHISGTPSSPRNQFGRLVRAQCRCDGREHRRLQKHGDIDVVPAGLDGVWEDDHECMILRLKISKDLFHRAAIDLGRDPVEAIVPHIIRA
ncbi:hypothetical protein [Rhizobium leguminosarum]